MNCNDVKRKLALLIGNDLEDVHASSIERHLSECPDCRETRRQLDDSNTALRIVRETPERHLGKSLWPRISAHLPQTTPHLPERTYLGWLPTATLAAACLVLLVFAGSTPYLQVQAPPVTPIDPSFKILDDLPTRMHGSNLSDLRSVQWPIDPAAQRDFNWRPRQQSEGEPILYRYDDM